VAGVELGRKEEEIRRRLVSEGNEEEIGEEEEAIGFECFGFEEEGNGGTSIDSEDVQISLLTMDGRYWRLTRARDERC
jgi:hypothetical protein